MIDFDMADIKPSVVSFVIVGVMATLFILLGKYVTTRWNVPVLREWFNAV